MDGIASKIKTPKKGNGTRVKTHHLFYVLVTIAGYIAPPLAVVIRFGVGRDFFINILLTIAGYFPGHFHNFYCQTIRSNNNKARTPRWAVKYGLVSVRKPRGGKHAWAGRYDERLPDSSRTGYAGGSTSSLPSTAETWDGQGPEPPLKDRTRNGIPKKSRSFSPWESSVDPDEVEGGPPSRGYGDDEDYADSGRGGDPLENEQFYATNTGSEQTSSRGAKAESIKKSKKGKGGIRGLLHRSRYEQQDGPETAGKGGDRFDRMNANAGRDGAEDEYQDDFERELNQGAASASASKAKAKTQARHGNGNGGGRREEMDEYEIGFPSKGAGPGKDAQCHQF